MSGSVETQGIDLVSPHERYGRPRDLFFLWAGTTTNIFTVSYGAMLVLLYGLSFTQALAVIVIGNVIAYPLLALTSIQGPLTGTTTMTISRASLGTRGARINGVLSWLMLIGFEAGGLILVYYACEALLARAGIALEGGAQITVVVLLAGIQLLLPLLGHRILMAAQKYATMIFTVAFIVLAALIIPQAAPGASAGTDSLFTMISATSLVIVSGGLSWAPSGANFSRYLPANSSPLAVGTWAALGGFIPYVLLQTLGAAMATVAVPDEVELSNPLAVPAILSPAFAVPFLILVMVGLLLQNGTNLYSSGLNLQTAGIHVPRMVIVCIDSLICVAICIFAIQQEAFYSLLNAFAASLSIWLAPWVTVYLLDWVARHGTYHLSGLAIESHGPYWGSGGVRWSGMAALLGGMLCSALFTNSGYLVGPLTRLLVDVPAAAPDLSIPAGVIASALIYLALRPVRERERAARRAFITAA